MNHRWRSFLLGGLSLVGLMATGWYFCLGREFCRSVEVPPGVTRLEHFADSQTVITSLAAWQQMSPPDAELPAPVDFSREHLVRMVWHADGPACGELRHASRAGGRTFRFYVDVPFSSSRTFTRRVHVSWFAVPAGSHLEWTTSSRVLLADLLFLIPQGLLLLFAGQFLRGHRLGALTLRPQVISSSATGLSA